MSTPRVTAMRVLVRGCGKLMRVRRVERMRVDMENGGFMADVCVCVCLALRRK